MPTCSGLAVRQAAPGKYGEASGRRGVVSWGRSADVPPAPSGPPHAASTVATAVNPQRRSRTLVRPPRWILFEIARGIWGSTPDTSSTLRTVSRRFPDGVRLEPGPGGLERLTLEASEGTAQVFLHGAHVTHFQPKGE